MKLNPTAAKRGLVLLVVTGLLGVLAMMVVVFLQSFRVHRSLTLNQLLKVKANFLAYSGYESMVRQVNENFLQYEHRLIGVPVGGGTLDQNGDTFTVRAQDANAKINLNDGVNPHADSELWE